MYKGEKYDAWNEEINYKPIRYVENGSLLSTLKAFGKFPEALVASYTQKILSGLAYLHEHEVSNVRGRCEWVDNV